MFEILNMMKFLQTLFLSLCFTVITQAKDYTVVTTTTMLSDLLHSIAGDKVHVVGLMGPATDPHLYRATAQDASKLRKADIIFYGGLHLEGRMVGLLEKIHKQKGNAYAVSDALPESKIIHYEGQADPHIWFDIELWSQTIPFIVEKLCKMAPEHSAYFQVQSEKAQEKYKSLHSWVLAKTQDLPSDKRFLITSHDAYGYFGRAYDFEVIGVQGISTMTEAGLADVIRIIDLIKEKHIKAIFVESSVSKATIERISEDSGATIGGELFSDALGAPGDIETGPDGEVYDLGTYEGTVKHNVYTITEALK